MSEDKVELLCTPYGEVAYESFRELGFAFADKSAVIKELERTLLAIRFCCVREDLVKVPLFRC